MFCPVVHTDEEIKWLQNDAHTGFPHGLKAVTVQFGVVQFVEHSAVDHFLLPLDGDAACAELPEEFLVLGIKRDVLDLRGVPELVRVLGVDHVGFWHPGGLHQPRLQTMEIDALEKHMVSWVLTTRDTKDV